MEHPETNSCNTKEPHGLGDILSLLMIECDIDDAKLSREIGIPASTISRIRLNPDANPTASTLRPIAKFFSISISQLLGDEPLSQQRIPGTHHPTPYTSARVPIIEWQYIYEWINRNQTPFNKKVTHWISTEKHVGNESFALTIPTDSLGIAFRKGSTIIIDPDRTATDGDFVLMQTDTKEKTLLKQFLTDGPDVYIRSINPEIKDIKPISGTDNIIGVIIETRFSLQENETTIEKKIKRTSFGLSAIRKPQMI